MKPSISLILFLITTSFCFGQNFEDLDHYTVDEFYEKLVLDDGALDEDGEEIEYVYIKTKVDSGDYKIELTESDGGLYEVRGRNIYIKFNAYFGYIGYSKDCILKVADYSATVYKLE